MFKRRSQGGSDPRRTQNSERRGTGGPVDGLCAGGAPRRGRWENQEVVGNGGWESFGYRAGLESRGAERDSRGTVAPAMRRLP